MFETVRKAVTWWLNELRSLVPRPLRKLFSRASGSFVIEWDEDTATLWHVRGDERSQLQIFELGGDGLRALRLPMPDGFARFWRKPPSLAVQLSPKNILRKQIRLPQSAEADLQDIIALQIERQTPFSREEVYFDYHILSRDSSTAAMSVEFAAVPRTIVEEPLAHLRRWGHVARVVSLRGDREDGISEFNFVGPSEIGRPGKVVRYATIGLVAVAVVLAATLVYLPIERKELELHRLVAMVETARVEAATTTRLKEEIAARVRDRRYLVTRKLEAPTVTGVLNELTRLLPDDTWLFQLDIKGKEVQLHGYSPASSDLIEPIERSPLFRNATFRSRVTRDPKSGLERFLLLVGIARDAD